MTQSQTPSQRHDWLVKAGAERYAETFAKVMKYMSQGGRTPGITVPTKAELLAIFEQMTPQAWMAIAQQDPAEAQSMLVQYKSVAPKELPIEHQITRQGISKPFNTALGVPPDEGQ